MGSFVGGFSTNPILAGAANIFTIVLGVWAIWKAISWLYKFAVDALTTSIRQASNKLKQRWARAAERCAADVTAYLAFITMHFMLMVLSIASLFMSSLDVRLIQSLKAGDKLVIFRAFEIAAAVMTPLTLVIMSYAVLAMTLMAGRVWKIRKALK